VLQNFLSRLKNHLLSRLCKSAYDGDEEEFSPAERNLLLFVRDRIYFHKAIRFNYTTYDMRRDQDSVNPRTHADVMVLSHEDEESNPHPYWYARIVGIFHFFVQLKDPSESRLTKPKKMDVLWVRWFGRNLEVKSGWAAKRLHQVGFLPASNSDAFGFLDPHHIIRASHLIPRFARGRTKMYLGVSDVRQTGDGDHDWVYYYVNWYVFTLPHAKISNHVLPALLTAIWLCATEVVG
jgi:hypothetical protein